MISLLITFTAYLLIVSGVIHWGYLARLITEDLRGVSDEALGFIHGYSIALAFLDIPAGIGLLYRANWAVALGVGIALSQICVHFFVIQCKRWAGVPVEWWRYLDVTLSVALPLTWAFPTVRAVYHST